jgi:hypothetical protein
MAAKHQDVEILQLEFLKERKPDVQPCALFLKQINEFFNKEDKLEDPLIGFQRFQRGKHD